MQWCLTQYNMYIYRPLKHTTNKKNQKLKLNDRNYFSTIQTLSGERSIGHGTTDRRRQQHIFILNWIAFGILSINNIRTIAAVVDKDLHIIIIHYDKWKITVVDRTVNHL